MAELAAKVAQFLTAIDTLATNADRFPLKSPDCQGIAMATQDANTLFEEKVTKQRTQV